jgi:hypothetical protein
MRLRFDNFGASLADNPRLTAADRDRLARTRTGDAAPRGRDANAGGRGEWPPTSGGINPVAEAFDQGCRRVRLSGRDQETGEHFGAELYLPDGGTGYGSGPAQTDDAALLCNLDHRDPFDDCAALGALQRALNRHYAR